MLHLGRHRAGGRNSLVGTRFPVIGVEGIGGCVNGKVLVGCKRDLRWIIHVPVFFGGDPRQVGLDEADGQKEGLILFRQLLKGLYGQIGNLAILEGIVRYIGALVNGAAHICFSTLVTASSLLALALFASCLVVGGGGIGNRLVGTRRGIGVGFRAGVVALGSVRFTLDVADGARRFAHQGCILGQGVDRGLGNLPWHGPRGLVIEASVKDFAHSLDEVSVVHEVLLKRDDLRDILAEMSHKIPDLGCVRAGAGHDTRARWGADRLLHIGTVKDHSALRQGVNVGALDVILAIASQLGPQVVDNEKEDVGLFRGGGLVGGLRNS